MKHTIEHDLEIDAARRVTDRAFAEYKSRYPAYEPTLRWADDRRADVSFNAKGIRLNGSMAIAERTIVLDLDVPFLLRPFQKKAVEVIDREVRRWMGKAQAGEL
jgi:hypothetical protein